MKFVSALSEADTTALETLYRDGSASHRARQRAHAVLLSSRGYTLEQLADLLLADRDTISGWLDAWQTRGLNGLSDAPKTGRPRKINQELENALLDILQNPSPNLKALMMDELKKKKSLSPGPR
jgi:transposase